jgi:hypothetical protein
MGIGSGAYHGFRRSLCHEESTRHDLGSFPEEVLAILLADNHHGLEWDVHTRRNGRSVQPVHRIGQQQSFDSGHRDQSLLL